MCGVPGISVWSGGGDHGNTAGIDDVLDHPFLVGHKCLHNLDSTVRKRDGGGLGAITECLAGASVSTISWLIEGIAVE